MPERTDQNADQKADPHTDPRGDLGAAVERLAGRLRSLPQRRLQAGAAATGLELARWLDHEAQSLEFPGREPYVMPDDGVFVVGDQLALAGRELIAAARLPEHRALLVEARERVARAARAID
ncbi:hypothetical protein [Actinacidiphila paucisporea]|uniref:Uncharacterized protein n=1 Tax=Actinacidiphila paucisporea TaxID=310782 RepID=A0A1M7F5Y1_9ACTN|nr:hypothetical protein [Actinacidiphila paucisporea]SHL99383.1 hypothetical protein SAMN05216499_107207 [Actinacidiphila paucisporea]